MAIKKARKKRPYKIRRPEKTDPYPAAPGDAEMQTKIGEYITALYNGELVMKYRKKPVVIEAVVWTGENFDQILALASSKAICVTNSGVTSLHIQTLEGLMVASIGDWIIKGVAGEIYPCKDRIFEQTYEGA